MENEVYQFHINGFQVEASYSLAFVQQSVRPLIKEWTKLYQTHGRRIIVFLAAPPAAGKSTLAALFEYVSIHDSSFERIQALGMDGFHHRQSYICSHSVTIDGKEVPMLSVKGSPETFDFHKFYEKIKCLSTTNCAWPFYNRKLHDVEEDKIDVDANIILIEGNYLLLDEEPWMKLSTLCDASIFIDTTDTAVKQRLIHRKMLGGTLPHAAIAFYEQSERRNIQRILQHRLQSTHTFFYDDEGYKEIKE